MLVSNRESVVCLEVGGVGYEVEMTPRDLATLPGVGEEIVLHTHTYVRDDDISLYGFAAEADRELFRVLLTAPGVGPKLGLAILASLTSEEVIRAVVTEDPDALTVTPGVGKRGAQKIVIELGPKLAGRDIEIMGGGGDLVTVRQALEGLGYSGSEINGVISSIDPDAPLDLQIKSALQNMGNR